nr:hypothetical protein [Tanacetum cinerariifolium]
MFWEIGRGYFFCLKTKGASGLSLSVGYVEYMLFEKFLSLIIGVPIFNFNSWGGILTKFSVLRYSVGYRSSTSPPSCPYGMALSWLVYVVVYPGSILITFALIISAVSFLGHTIAFSCIPIQDVFSGSYSPGIPTVPSPTLRSQSVNVDTSFFSASNKFLWVEESFISNSDLNREWAV